MRLSRITIENFRNLSLSRPEPHEREPLANGPSLRADDPVEVLIEHQAVKPALLRIAIDRTILFVNRSGKPIDVTFLGYRGMHHVSESAAQLTVVFHHAGRHPYIVTFGGSDESHLHGLVEVDESLSHGREPPVCTG